MNYLNYCYLGYILKILIIRLIDGTQISFHLSVKNVFHITILHAILFNIKDLNNFIL